MNRHRRWQSNIFDTLKDYAVPIIGVLFLIIIIWSVSTRWGENEQTATHTQTIWWESLRYIASFWNSETRAQVVYSGWRREDISDGTEVFPGETIVVQDWRVTLSPSEDRSIHLNRIAEFRVEWQWKYSLLSSDAWINSTNPIQVTMRYATVTSGDNTIMSLTQNEAGSTIYVLKWNIQVQNSVWVQTRVIAWQRLSVPRVQASNRDFDITSERVDIDTFFQNSDWFLENDGHLIDMSQVNEDIDIEDNNEIDTNEVSTARSNLIRFDRLRDEMSVESGSINVSGTLLSDNIWAISIQNTPVELSTSARSFNLDNIALPWAMNDLVVKIYDTERNILAKEVYTVYSSSPSRDQSSTTSSSSETSTPTTNQQTTTHFDIDASKFRFTAPSTTGRFTTTSSEVTLRGETTADNIARVEINGFRLNSFNGRTWRYHAFKRFDTIREGTNQYRVDYFDNAGKLVYTDFFTIILQAPWTATTPNNQASQNTSSSQDSTPSDSTSSEDTEDTTDNIPTEPESLFWN